MLQFDQHMGMLLENSITVYIIVIWSGAPLATLPWSRTPLAMPYKNRLPHDYPPVISYTLTMPYMLRSPPRLSSWNLVHPWTLLLYISLDLRVGYPSVSCTPLPMPYKLRPPSRLPSRDLVHTWSCHICWDLPMATLPWSRTHAKTSSCLASRAVVHNWLCHICWDLRLGYPPVTSYTLGHAISARCLKFRPCYPPVVSYTTGHAISHRSPDNATLPLSRTLLIMLQLLRVLPHLPSCWFLQYVMSYLLSVLLNVPIYEFVDFCSSNII